MSEVINYDANDNVNITYSDYSNTPVIQEVNLELFENINLQIKYNRENETVTMNMSDIATETNSGSDSESDSGTISDTEAEIATTTETTELEGELDVEKVSALIKILTQLRNQIKMHL